MTASESYQLQNTELKVVAPIVEPAMHAIPGQNISTAVATKSLQDTANIFSITYTYQNSLHHTRVMKVGSTASETFYKVVLSSQVCGSQCLCWLKQQKTGWEVLLGQPIDAELLSAIATAIEMR